MHRCWDAVEPSKGRKNQQTAFALWKTIKLTKMQYIWPVWLSALWEFRHELNELALLLGVVRRRPIGAQFLSATENMLY